jgi:hypothetical protein
MADDGPVGGDPLPPPPPICPNCNTRHTGACPNPGDNEGGGGDGGTAGG